MTAAPGASAATWSATTGSGSHSMATSSAASSASARLSATTAITGCPCQTARSAANNCLRRRSVSGPVQRDADERLAPGIDVGSGKNRSDARCLLGSFGVDRPNSGMGMGTADEADVQHARQLDVVDEAAVAAEQALELPPRKRCADPAALLGGFGLGCTSAVLPPFLALITASTASTMAW